MTGAAAKLKARMAVYMAMASMMGDIIEPQTKKYTENSRQYNRAQPWDMIHLSKSERKGKTPKELQDMRMEKYNATAPQNGSGAI